MIIPTRQEGTAVHSGNEQQRQHPPTHQQLSNKEIVCWQPGALCRGYFCEKLRIQQLISSKASLTRHGEAEELG
jgi:hypothetical protein